jgi:hypothetical protein
MTEKLAFSHRAKASPKSLFDLGEVGGGWFKPCSDLAPGQGKGRVRQGE